MRMLFAVFTLPAGLALFFTPALLPASTRWQLRELPSAIGKRKEGGYVDR
jgi:hypothetical protein